MNHNRRAALSIILTTLVLLACDLTQIAQAPKPTIVLGSPPHGATVPQGQEILVQANASDATSIARVELWVDYILVTATQPPTPQAQFPALLRWMPTSPGAHTLAVKAINAANVTSDPVAVTITVVASEPLPTSAPTSPPTLTSTPQPPTALPPTPTLVSTPTATRAPTAVPTKSSINQPVYGAITFSSSIDEKTAMAINPGKTFAQGIKIIYASWTYSGLGERTTFDADWYRNGQLVTSSPEVFSQPSGRAFIWLLYGYVPTTPLEAGNYQLNVRVGGKTVLSDSFVIQPSASATNTITVFFTIQNSSPTGYVIDKQGNKHSPPGYLTITGIPIAAGDRILIQTDAARFSLLFDCGVNPDSFSPCDFSADTPAKLPSEIRVNKSGRLGWFNISRADNWAGLRAGFEPQRYPADPILRIGLGN